MDSKSLFFVSGFPVPSTSSSSAVRHAQDKPDSLVVRFAASKKNSKRPKTPAGFGAPSKSVQKSSKPGEEVSSQDEEHEEQIERQEELETRMSDEIDTHLHHAEKKSAKMTALERKARNKDLDKVLERFGLQKSKLTQAARMDSTFQAKKTEEISKKRGPTVYQRLAQQYGVEALVKLERGVQIALFGLLTVWVGSGISISLEAYYKSSKNEIPDWLTAIASNAEVAFTPSVVAFLALSSMYGLYKINQLESPPTRL
mmetsp:Transcript_2881/g.5029  ORF Transcript_2881/g.5029 Transcript_2881/m.5029 type:complete len:257 (-) Transcript_2881:191-961(-)|eukprot:CAMPEP_0184691554 /NCGR_PEP_ID=MMETSP0313-20130426/375_1 /TAXON_ID=2792 /ORGANISM="Porphyridium aerugineum, Strain SAG 1380-2" /LENGTH=256 /DNA_ID=CAMNT_0027149297 /DNA_START=52 /DNA_END=822 /DNA_ORIENTATION=+